MGAAPTGHGPGDRIESASHGCSVGAAPVAESIGRRRCRFTGGYAAAFRRRSGAAAAIQKEHLLEVLDERFLRHLAETEERLHDEIGTLRAEVGKEIGTLRAEVGKEIGTLRTDLGNQIADVRKELNTQTRWILAVMVGATVLIPVMQRMMAALFP